MMIGKINLADFNFMSILMISYKGKNTPSPLIGISANLIPPLKKCFGSAGNGVTPFFLSGYHDHPYRPWVIHRGLRELQDFALRAADILRDVG
jgi:hypothetical protein